MLWRIIRLLCASRSYSERSAADAARYGLSGLAVSVVIISVPIGPLRVCWFLCRCCWCDASLAPCSQSATCRFDLVGRFWPVIVESLCLRSRPQGCGAFAQVFRSGWRGRFQLFLPLLIPHPHPAGRSLVSKVDDAVERLAAQFARHPKRLRDRFDAVADCARQCGAENDVTQGGADRVIDDLCRLGRNTRGDDRQKERLDRRLDAVVPVGHELRCVLRIFTRPLKSQVGCDAHHQIKKEKADRDPERPTEVPFAEAPGETSPRSGYERSTCDAGDIPLDEGFEQNAGDDREAQEDDQSGKQKQERVEGGAWMEHSPSRCDGLKQDECELEALRHHASGRH